MSLRRLTLDLAGTNWPEQAVLAEKWCTFPAERVWPEQRSVSFSVITLQEKNPAFSPAINQERHVCIYTISTLTRGQFVEFLQEGLSAGNFDFATRNLHLQMHASRDFLLTSRKILYIASREQGEAEPVTSVIFISIFKFQHFLLIFFFFLGI